MNVNDNEWIWTEKYRPQTVEDCILPVRLKAKFQAYVDEGKIPNLLLSGSAGSGKTTVAMAMCDQLGISCLKVNASDERGIDVFRTTIRDYASTISLLGTNKVIILDEADNLTEDAQKALRGAIEEYSHICTFILTCNYKARLIDPIHSRTTVIDFDIRPDESMKMQATFFKRIKSILDNENVEYDSKVLVTIIGKYFPDYRRTINEIQSLAQNGAIDQSVLEQISEVRNLSELCEYLKDKNFSKMRKWVVDNGNLDHALLFRKIYDSMYTTFKPESIPQAVLIIHKYLDSASRVVDQEINSVAMLTELMVECQFS